MVALSKCAKVYIVSPYHKTGGPKSLHQLANILVDRGADVYMVYYSGKEIREVDVVLYPECKAKLACEIEDKKENVVITSEFYSGILLEFSCVKKVIWWLSLDFYLTNKVGYRTRLSMYKKGYPQIMYPLMIAYKLCFKRNENPRAGYIKDKKDFQQIFHMYNCEYVRSFLQDKGVEESQMHYLCGPLEESYLNVCKKGVLAQKEDVIIYNPAKNNKVYFDKLKKAISKRNKSVVFLPIQNMSREEVYQSISKAKLYMDFGYFPGPERMPREAVTLFCNLIVAKKGSAQNSVDVPIPDEFKFASSDSNISKIASLAVDMIANYDTYVDRFDVYRDKVREQILRFSADIQEIFDVE